jgi:penicillin-binding protein 2
MVRRVARRMLGPVRRPLKDARSEAALFQRRALVAMIAVVLCTFALGARFAWLQVSQHEEYVTRSDSNRIRLRPIMPTRGLIFDRNGRLLADNVPEYRLELIPEQIEDLAATLQRLQSVLPLSEDELERFRESYRGKRRFQSVPLKFRLTEAEVARFAVDRQRFNGVEVVPYLSRRYPYGELFGHMVGYVGRIDTADQQRIDAARYAGTTHIGKMGIERVYENRLHGTAGFEQVEVNAEGRTLRVLSKTPVQSGEHLYLSIDAELQRATVAAFEGQHGAAIAIDPDSGEVLAMVSLPGFDPNLFVNGISHAAYAALNTSQSRPLFDRALQGGYEPGSTIKPFVGLIGLETGIRRPGDTTFSSGAFRLAGQKREYRDWRRGGHGHVNLKEALAQSVNTYFFQLAVDLGIDRFSSQMARFGFGRPTGIDLTGEVSGILPSREWKRRARNEAWYPGDTVNSGIGQGFWVVTPIQLAQATATLAARGRAPAPHLLRATQAAFDGEVVQMPLPPPPDAWDMDPRNVEAIIDGLVAVMHGPTGTARASAVGSPYRIAGKTGTAQRISRVGEDSLKVDELPFDKRHRALFMGFAPAEAPRIAVMVVVESGGSGSLAAAPIARRIMDAWLLRSDT